MKDFFSRLNYSFGNEDWKIERKALKIAYNHHVLCITASGDRPLNLLIDECASLTSVDANPVQNHLLSLKCAALQTLEHKEYIGFLGAETKDDREKIFEKVLKRLPKEAANFWKNHPKMIQKGVLYQGQIERLTKIIAHVTDILRPKKVKRLFEIDNLEEQRDFVKKEWDTFLLRKTFDVMLCRAICKLIAFDPGLYKSVESSMSLGAYIYNRMLNSLNHTLAKENMIISLIFRGFVGQEAFPPYLTAQGAETIQKRLSVLSVRTADVISYLQSCPDNSIDRFSLSDVASYLDKEGYYQMIENISRTAKPGARFCIRQFSSNHKIPEKFLKNFKRELELEKELEQEDSSFFYRFNVGTIVKSYK